MNIINNDFLSKLAKKAELSSRRRSHKNLHQSYDKKVQRLLISLKKENYVEPHYHKLQHQCEMFVVLEGVLELKIYNITGDAIERHLIGEKKDNRIVELSPM